MNDKKNEKITNLQEEFNKIQEDNKNFDANMYLAKVEDLPELGDIQIYDYESDVQEVSQRANDVLDSLVDLFLGDAPNVVDHPYIQNKVKEDAQVYAQTLFLTNMTRKIFISQMRSIDNGSNGAREYEVINQTMGQYRENIKFFFKPNGHTYGMFAAGMTKSFLEKNYKQYKLGLKNNDHYFATEIDFTNVYASYPSLIGHDLGWSYNAEYVINENITNKLNYLKYDMNIYE